MIVETICEAIDAKQAQDILQSSDAIAVLYGWQHKNDKPVEVYPEEFDSHQALERRIEQIIRAYDKHHINSGRTTKSKESDFLFYVLYKKSITEAKKRKRKSIDPLFTSVEDMKKWVAKHQKGLSPFATLTQDVGNMDYNNALFNASFGNTGFTSGGTSADGAAMSSSGGLGESLDPEKLTVRCLKLIEEHKDLLQVGDAKSLEMIYREYEGDFVPTVGEFTTVLLELGVDPAKTLQYIPANYLCETDITEYTIADDCNFIDNWAFSGSKLKHIDIPDSVQVIEVEAFSDTFYLEDIKFSKNLGLIDARAFCNSGIEVVDLRDTKVHTIETGAFSGCQNLKHVYMPATLKSLAMTAFTKCPELETIEFDCTESEFRDNILQGIALYGCQYVKLKFKD